MNPMAIMYMAKIRAWDGLGAYPDGVSTSGETPVYTYPVLDARAALTQRHDSDAHTVQYVLTAAGARVVLSSMPRLKLESLTRLEAHGLTLRFASVFIDFDDALTHGTKTEAGPEWRQGFEAGLAKVPASVRESLVVYETRGGARLVLVLGELVDLPTFVAIRDGLHSVCRTAGLGPDPLHDWTRMFRLPRVTRDGAAQERPIRIEGLDSPIGSDVLSMLADLGRRSPLKPPEPPPSPPSAQRALAYGGASSGERPGDVWMARTSWSELLTRWGWTFGGMSGTQERWFRPGKPPKGEPSALTGYGGVDRLHVFSTNAAPLEPGKSYDKLGVLALYEHGASLAGAVEQAAREIGHERPTEDPAVIEIARELRAVSQEREEASEAAARASVGLPPSPRTLPPENRPTVLIDGENMGDVCRETAKALARTGRVFVRGGRVVEVAKNGETGTWTRALDADGVTDIVKDLVVYRQRGKGKNAGYESVPIPERHCRVMLRGNGEGHIPELRAVMTHPIMRPDGTIHQTPGYDSVTRCYFEPAGEVFPRIAERPSAEDVAGAVDALRGLYADFPFSSPDDLAVALVGAATGLVRHLCPNAPYVFVSSNVRGAGKTKIALLAGIIIEGAHPCVTPAGDLDEQELRKFVTMTLLDGSRTAILDNLSSSFGSSALDALATSGEGGWKDRTLGKSEGTKVPNLTTWFATGVNLTVQADSTRRAVLCHLLSPLEEPESRTDIQITDIEAHAIRHRPVLVAALLTILRAYHASGERVALRPTGSFSEWSRHAREPLVWVGVGDAWATNARLKAEGAPQDAQLAALLRAWRAYYEDRPASVREAVQAATSLSGAKETALKNAILDVTGKDVDEKGLIKVLAYRLRAARDRVMGGMRFALATMEDGNRRWVVVVSPQVAMATGWPLTQIDDFIQ